MGRNKGKKSKTQAHSQRTAQDNQSASTSADNSTNPKQKKDDGKSRSPIGNGRQHGRHNEPRWNSPSKSGDNVKGSTARQKSEAQAEFVEYCSELKSNTYPQFVKIKEIEGDLFEMPTEYSLAHCVAEDMNMGSGIAVQFRHDFKRVDELLSQHVKTGSLAILKHKDRFIYYLVTKRVSTGKPTYESLFSSLLTLRDHIQRNNIKKVAMPRIGCGLDRLDWENVKFMIEYVFRIVDIDIIVCNLLLTEAASQPQRHRSLKVTHVYYPIQNIEAGTIIVYLSSEDGHISEEMKELDKKFFFLKEFKSAKKIVGNVMFYTKTSDYLLCGCIVKNKKKDLINFIAFQKCLRAIQIENGKYIFNYIAIQAFRDKLDSVETFKIVNLMRNCLRDVEVYVCWPGDLKEDLNYLHGSRRFSFEDIHQNTIDDTMRSKDDEESTGSQNVVDNQTNHWNNPNSGDSHTKNTPSFNMTDPPKDRWSGREDAPSKPMTPIKCETQNQREHSRDQELKVQYKKMKYEISPHENLKFEFEKFQKERNNIKLNKVKHQQPPKKHSRVHYVRTDMTVESSVPKDKECGLTSLLGEFLNKNLSVGECASVKNGVENVYCLVVKSPLLPPTPLNAFSSIQKLCDHVKTDNVKTLVIPKMADSEAFKWSEFGYMFEFIFKNANVEIIVEASSSETPDKKRNVKHCKETIRQVKKKSMLLFLASVDGRLTKPMEDLNEKFDFKDKFTKAKKLLGDFIKIKDNEDYVIYGCVVKKKDTDSIDFVLLQKCLNAINEKNRKNENFEIAYLQAEKDVESGVNFKLCTLLLTCLPYCSILMGWPGDLFNQKPNLRP